MVIVGMRATVVFSLGADVTGRVPGVEVPDDVLDPDLLGMLDERMSTLARFQDPNSRPASPITIIRRMFRDRQISKATSDQLQKVIHVCSLVGTCTEVGHDQALSATENARSGLEQLRKEFRTV